MKEEITIINPKEYGLEEKKGNELTVNLTPILEERNILTKQFAELMREEFSPELAKRARELRLLVVKNRTQGIGKWHNVVKAYFLSGGRFVDAKKNMEIAVNERMESDLSEIEKRQEREDIEEAEKIIAIEQKRLEFLQNKRVQLISNYIEDAEERDLASMDEDVWVAYLSTKKQEHEMRLKNEKEAEEKRIAEAKAEKERLEAIEKENSKLKIEAENREKEEAKRKEKEEKERLEREAKEKKEAEKQEAKLQVEREAKEKLEQQLKDQKEAKEKAEKEDEERKQFELNKGDGDKVSDLKNDLNILKTKYEFKSKKNKKMYSEIGILIDKTINHIK